MSTAKAQLIAPKRFSLLFVEMNFDGSFASRNEDGVPRYEADHGHGHGRRNHELVYDHVVEIGFVHGDERTDGHFRAVGECGRLPADDSQPGRWWLVALVGKIGNIRRGRLTHLFTC